MSKTKFQKEQKRKKKRIEIKKRKLTNLANLRQMFLKFDKLEEKRSEPVDLTSNFDYKSVIENLEKAISITKNGIGLSAPQIGCYKRIIIIRPDLKTNTIQHFINPRMIEITQDMTTMKEGCLSYPGYSATADRYVEIKLEYDTENGKEEQTFKGIESRIIQHEIDHLNGKCVVADEYKKSKEYNF